MKRIDRYDLLNGLPNPVEGRASWHIGLEPTMNEIHGTWCCPTCTEPVAGTWQQWDKVMSLVRGHWLRAHA